MGNQANDLEEYVSVVKTDVVAVAVEDATTVEDATIVEKKAE